MYHFGALRSIIRILYDAKETMVVPSLKFDVLDILASLDKYKCNGLLGLPKILLNIVTHPDRKNYDLSNLKAVLSGGQLASIDLILKFKNELNVQAFIVAYSSTESNNGISSDRNKIKKKNNNFFSLS